MTTRQLAILTMVGGGLAVAGSLLPWATVSTAFGSIDIPGTDGDGIFTLGLGALTALLGFIRFGGPARYLPALASIAGLALIVIGAFEYANLTDRLVASDVARASTGVGLYLVLLGGVSAFLGGMSAKPA